MDVASEKKEKSKMKKKRTFLVEVTEQSLVPFTKKEYGRLGVRFDVLNFSCLWGTPCKSICSSG